MRMHLSALCRPAQCDTLHALIKEYRDTRKILLNVEHRLMMHFAPDLDSLTLLQKVEVFKHALAHTSGMDLYRVLWMKVCDRHLQSGMHLTISLPSPTLHAPDHLPPISHCACT